MKIRELLSEAHQSELDEGRYGSRDAYQRDYDSSRTGFSRGRRDDDEYHVPDPSPSHDHARKETTLYNIKVGGQAVNPKPILGRSNAIAWAKHAIAQGQFTAAEATLSPVHGMSETATAGGTSAGAIGTIANPHHSPGKARGKKSYLGDPWGGISGTKAPPQPKVVQPKTKAGTAKNGLDIKGTSLFGGPANESTVIKRR